MQSQNYKALKLQYITTIFTLNAAASVATVPAVGTTGEYETEIISPFLVSDSPEQVDLGKQDVKQDHTDVSSVFLEHPVNTNTAYKSNPDSPAHFWREIENIAQNLRDSNSISDVSIDPNKEISKLNRPEDIGINEEIEIILDRHKGLFRGDCGEVNDDRFVVRGKIDRRFVSKRIPNYFAKMPPDVLAALEKTLNEQIANNVLIKLPKDMFPENIISIFAVGKRNQLGDIVLNANSCRIVIDCSRNLNQATSFKARQTDAIHEIIQKVARYTKLGYIAVMDIKSMFYCFKLERSLWPFFCVEHPRMGLFAFKRTPMGWLVSPSACREYLMQILYKHRGYCYRYLDDIIVVANSRGELMTNLDGILATLEYFNFRLKGSKVTILGTTIKVLGKTLKDGMIFANDHVLKDLGEMNSDNIVTKKHLKRFNGCINYIAEHVPFVTELLYKLRQAAIGPNNSPVEWTDVLRKDLRFAKDKMSDLLTICPVDPDKDIIGVIDSSFFANAGFFYQYDGSKKCFIKIFSRRRSDAENKRRPSSCYVELTGIVAAMTAATVELEICKKQIVIKTDSKSVVDLFNRMRRSGVPSQDRKINECFGKLMGFNYEIEYMSADEPPLQFADYISRTKAASTPCDGCLICDSIDPGTELFFIQMEKINNWVCEMSWETSLVPTLEYGKYKELQSPIYPSNLPADITYPYGADTGWMNTFVRDNSLSSLNMKSENVMSIQVAVLTRHMAEYVTRSILDLTSDIALLINWQSSCPVLRKTAEILSARIDIPNKHPRVVTQIVSKKAKLRNGLIVYPRRNDLGIESEIIALPERYKNVVVHIFHNTLGHGAISKIENDIKNV